MRLRGDSQRPLHFMWDNFSGHFAQMLRGTISQDAQPKEMNPAFWTVPKMFASRGVQNVQMMFLPRYMPQFSPCERVFSHMKTYIANHSPARENQISESQLFQQVHEYLGHLNDRSIINLIEACHYRTAFAQQPPRPPTVNATPELATNLCNNLDLHQVSKLNKQIVCASASTGLISRYLPKGSDRWYVLSQLSTLFEEQRAHIIDDFRNANNVRSSHYFAIYSGYGGSEGFLIRMSREQETFERIINNLWRHINNFPVQFNLLRVFQPSLTWLAITYLNGSSDWRLQPVILQNKGEYMIWSHENNGDDNKYFAVLHCGQQTSAVKVNFLVGRTEHQVTNTDFSAIPANQIGFFSIRGDMPPSLPQRTIHSLYERPQTAPRTPVRFGTPTGVQRTLRQYFNPPATSDDRNN